MGKFSTPVRTGPLAARVHVRRPNASAPKMRHQSWLGSRRTQQIVGRACGVRRRAVIDNVALREWAEKRLQGIGTAQALDRKSKNDRPRAAPLQDIGVKAHRRQRLRDSRHALQKDGQNVAYKWRLETCRCDAGEFVPPASLRRGGDYFRATRTSSPAAAVPTVMYAVTMAPLPGLTKRTVAGRRAARVAALVARRGWHRGRGHRRRRPVVAHVNRYGVAVATVTPSTRKSTR